MTNHTEPLKAAIESKKGFEEWARREGVNLQPARADDTCEDGRFPATYYYAPTETAWRAWANKPSALTASAAAKGEPVADEREAFEADLQRRYGSMGLARHGERYIDIEVDDMWRGWQARAALSTAQQGRQEPTYAEPEFSTDPDGEMSIDWLLGDDAISISIGGSGILSWVADIGGKTASGSRTFDVPRHDAALSQQAKEREPEEIIEKLTLRQHIQAAWCAGYYHAGYTHDQAYADQEASKYLDEVIALFPLAAPVQQSPIKDHVIRETVNELRDIAIQFHASGQLRERIAHVIVPLLKDEAVQQEAKPEQESK